MRRSIVCGIALLMWGSVASAGPKSGNMYLQFARTGIGDLTEWVVRIRNWSVEDIASCRTKVANQLMAIDGSSIRDSVLDQVAQLQRGRLPDTEVFNSAEAIVAIIHDQVGPEIINCAVQVKNGGGSTACSHELDNVRRVIVTNLWAVTQLRQAATSTIVATCNPRQQP